MITLEQYFGRFSHTAEQQGNAELLLARVNLLLDDAVKYGVVLKIDPDTKCFIGGNQYGGFRPENCPIGAQKSAHKLAMAVDIYDPYNALDVWLDDAKLLKYNLCREHPDYTPSWVHLSTKMAKSGKLTFIP